MLAVEPSDDTVEAQPATNVELKTNKTFNNWCSDISWREEYQVRNDKRILNSSTLQPEIPSMGESKAHTIQVNSWQMRWWLRIRWYLCVWNFMWTVFCFSFGVVVWPCGRWSCTPNGLSMALDIILELCYIAFAIVLRFYIPCPDMVQSKLWNSVESVAMLTTTSYSWWMDVVSSLMCFLGYIAPVLFPYVWCPRLLRTVHLFFDVDSKVLRPEALKQVGTVSILWLLLSVFAFSHVLACFWFFVATFSWSGSLESFKTHIILRSHSEFHTAQDSFAFEESVLVYYEWSLHWAIMTLSSLDFPACENYFERFALSFCVPIMTLFMGLILSRLVGVVHALTLMSSKADQDAQYLECAMMCLGLPPSLRQAVSRYHNYTSLSMRSDAQHLLSTSISNDINIELLLFMYKDLIDNAPFFQPLNTLIVIRLVQQFQDSAYCPGDIIIRKGVVGREMYFLLAGYVEVTLEIASDPVIATKAAGDYFGEIALVIDTVRTAWVRSLTYCRTTKLTKRSLDEVFVEQPEQKDAIMDMIVQMKDQLSIRPARILTASRTYLFLEKLDKLRPR